MAEVATIVEREIKRVPSTERTKLLKERYLKEKLTVCAERAIYITESMKKTEGEPIVIRRAKAFKYMLEHLTPIIRDGELIVGNQTKFVRGAPLFPDWGVQWIKDELGKIIKEEDKFMEVGKGGGIVRDFATFKLDFTEEDVKRFQEAIDYWDGKSLDCLSRRFYGEETNKYEELKSLESCLVITPSGISWMEGRMVLDFAKVLNKGFNGIIKEIEEKLKDYRKIGRTSTIDDMNKIIFWKAGIIVCEGVINWAKNYAREAKRLAKKETDAQRKKELEKIAEICSWVPGNPARKFYEALQSFWFTFLAGLLECGPFGNAPGRFDQYIYPFYKKDKEENKITREEVIELLECLRVKHTEIERVTSLAWVSLGSGSTFQNVMLGGCTEDGEDASNELSHLILESAMTMQTIAPTLSIRYNDKLNEDLLLKAVELIKTGIGMPAFFNDAVAIPHHLHFSKASLEDARDWAIGGCNDMTIPHRVPGVNGCHIGFTNFGKYFELALNNGMDPLSGRQISIKTGDVEAMSYDEIVEAFEKQTRYIYHLAADYTNLAWGFHPYTVPLIYSSVLHDDCIERGKHIDEGGARYYGDACTWFIVGLIHVANSLAAIKKCVFEDKSFTMKELKEALKANFEGYEQIHKKLLDAPKFGNDDDYVDQIATDLYKFVAQESLKQKSYFGYPVPPSAYSVTTHPPFGRACGALPDGRKAGLPLCDGGVSAFPGTDINGPTALIQSATKIDSFPYMAVMLNMKFHPTAMKGLDGARNLLSLIKTYMDRRGWHIQFNVVDNAMLRDAQKHPERYRDLLVRVAGFSAHWVELPKVVQDEIIARTEYRGL